MLKIYKASAGSGKTYTLAYEFIRMLLSVKNPDTGERHLNHRDYIPGGHPFNDLHRHILAITFTNKATEEMKRRIIDELDLLSTAPASPTEKDCSKYAPDLTKDLGCTRHALAETAQRALRQLLCNYNDFNVGTIDSFFQRVLRTFARELDHQGDFAVELSEQSVMQTSVGSMLDDFNIDMNRVPGLEKWIYQRLTSKIDEGKSSNFFNRSSNLYSEIIKLVSQITQEKFKPHLEATKKYLSDNPSAKIDILRDKLKETVEARKKKLAEMGAEALRIIPAEVIDKINGKCPVGKYLTTLAPEGLLPQKTKFWEGSYVKKAMECDPGYFNKGANVEYIHLETIANLLLYGHDMEVKGNDFKIIHESLDNLELLGHVWRYIDAFVAENNTILLSDTPHLISRIIGHDETPFVYERMGIDLRHFLIDEFQDTSKMQWLNLKPLVSNSMSQQHDNLIIGDEKQSIYRFRNSDSSLLRRQVAYEDFPAPRYDTRIFGNADGENTNYRSAADVVRFNNTLFSRLARDWHIEGYDNVVQKIHNTDKKGYVRMLPYSKESPTDPAMSEAEDLKFRMIQDVGRNIIEQHHQGGYPWSHIAVLVNRKKEGAQVIRQLSTQFPEIPFISDEALFLRNSSAINTIVGVLRLFAHESAPQRHSANNGKRRYPTMAEAAVLISRYRRYRNLGHGHEESISMAVVDFANNTDMSEISASLRDTHPTTLIQLIETVIQQCLSDSDRRDQCAFIAAFQDYALEYCKYFNTSVKAFLDNWEISKETLSVSVPGSIDAVSVLTIHKSKGLEFDCVHIPFASWSDLPKEHNQWTVMPVIEGIDPSLCPPVIYTQLNNGCKDEISLFHSQYASNLAESKEDCINKTYVAYTRAVSELAIYYQAKFNIAESLCSAIKQPMPDDCRDNPNLIDLADAFDDNSGILVIGSPTRYTPSVTDNKVTIEPAEYNVYTDNATEILTGVDDMLDLDRDIDAPDTEYTYDTDDGNYIDEEARLRGIILHDIFSMMHTTEDLESALTTASMLHRIDPDDVSPLRNIITEMIAAAGERASAWFSTDAKVLTEQTIYSPDADIDRRLDRLVIYPDGSADIIDYKFTTRKSPRHRSQVAEYIRLVADMGYAPVRAYLWYPLDNEIIKI